MAKKSQKMIDETIEDLKEEINKQVKKQIKENVVNEFYDYKKELNKEIEKSVNLEVQKAIKQEHKKLLHRKNIVLFKCYVIIILLLAIIGYFGYCLYKDKYFDFMKDNNDTTTVKEVEVKEEKKTQEWYKEQYSYLLNSAHLKLDTNLLDSYILYNANFTINQIRNTYLLNIAYSNLDQEKISIKDDIITIDSKDLQEIFIQKFSVKYIPEDFNYECLKFSYNTKKNNYVANNNICQNQSKEIVEDITYISENDDYIYIDTVAAVYDNDLNLVYRFNDLYNPILEKVTKDKIFENKSKLNQYKYTFKKNANTYYFEAIEKLN